MIFHIDFVTGITYYHNIILKNIFHDYFLTNKGEK